MPVPKSSENFTAARFRRLKETDREPVGFVVDGRTVTALKGDTVLTAILTCQRWVRDSEFTGEPRAGFCLMGACQDCWIRLADGKRVRACSTIIEEGMEIVTRFVTAGERREYEQS